MAMYYYACRLSAACGSGARRSPPPLPPLQQVNTVSTISQQPGPSQSLTKAAVVTHGSPLLPAKPLSKENHNPQEPEPDLSEAMVYREGNLVSGRLEALIQHMVPTLDYYPDRAFLFAFLLTSRLFVKPHDLLGQILALTESQAKDVKEEGPSKQLVRLIGEWSETFPYDFRDERVMSHVRQIAESCVCLEDSPRSAEVSALLHSLLDKLTSLERYEAYVHSVRAQATTNLSILSQTDVSELCGSAVSLAQQLTHIELERLSYIGPEEFVQAFAKESPDSEPRITHNYEIYIEWFPRLVALVLTDIVRQKKSKKNRLRVVEFWIETAKECFNIGNFNSLMAIIAGLNKPPVSRLKKTWSTLNRSDLSSLERDVSFYDDYSSYRTSLKAAASKGKSAIVVPLFSLLASDLHTLCQECLTKLPNGHINFEKFWQLAKQVTEFITWKQVHCPFPKSPKVITYLQATPVLNEDAAMLCSFECEPPETAEEIELHKKLLGMSFAGRKRTKYRIALTKKRQSEFPHAQNCLIVLHVSASSGNILPRSSTMNGYAVEKRISR